MKKKLTIALLLMCFFGLSACKNATGTSTIDIRVTQSQQALAGVTVYMYDTQTYNILGIDDPLFADKQAVTDNEGTATFSIDELAFGLDDRATFYFATYDNNKKVSGQVGVTVGKGETKTADIKL